MLAALMALLLQARTAEDRLRELEGKLGELELRQKALADENGRLEKRTADAAAARETWARQTASAWVKRYAATASFSETQGAELEALWVGWLKEGVDAKGWQAREAALRGKLSAEQAPRLARAVREEQEKSLRMSIGSFLQAAKIAPERAPAVEKALLARLPLAEGALLSMPTQSGWLRVYGAVEAGLPELILSDPERAALAELLVRWKPK